MELIQVHVLSKSSVDSLSGWQTCALWKSHCHPWCPLDACDRTSSLRSPRTCQDLSLWRSNVCFPTLDSVVNAVVKRSFRVESLHRGFSMNSKGWLCYPMVPGNKWPSTSVTWLDTMVLWWLMTAQCCLKLTLSTRLLLKIQFPSWITCSLP